MINIPDEKNSEHVIQRALNSIPSEIINKFPEYKVIIKMVNQLINEGCSPKEIETRIAQSKEYKNLEKIQDQVQVFQNELQNINSKKDLVDWEENQRYMERIQKSANRVFMDKEISSDLDCIIPVHWYKQIGYVITEKQLAVELAKIGKLICLGRAFNMLDLLSLLTGVAILPRDGNNDVIAKIIEKQDFLLEYISEFESIYKVNC